MSVRVVIAEHDPDSRNRMREIVGSCGHEIAGLARDGHEALQTCMQLNPDVAFISQDLRGISGAQTCEMLSALLPATMPVLVVDKRTPDSLEVAMRHGARGVVSRPLEPAAIDKLMDQLAEAVVRSKSPEVQSWKDPSRYPKVITVTGAKGGVGKSTIAVNLAIVMAANLPNQVALLDMYTQFGDIATMLNVMPVRTISDIIQSGDEIDEEVLNSCAVKHQSGVHVFVTTETPLSLDAVSPERLDNLLYMLRRMYRYIVIDMPPILNEPTLHVLAHSNSIFLIANLFDLTTATDNKKLFDTLQAQMIPRENIGIILNRASKANRLQIADLQAMFEQRVVLEVPNDSRLVNTINQGVPLAANGEVSPLVTSLAQLSRTIMGTTDSRTVEKPAGLMGLFRARQGA